MMELYNRSSFSISKLITDNYSTSFSLGIKSFDSKYRDPIFAIYGFVRLADEIVDTFHGYDKEAILNKFKADTLEAIDLGISTNPILHSFQQIVNKYNIDKDLILEFLKSMEMDLTNSYYHKKQYDEYIYGSAESVGLMCLKVFTNNDIEKYEQLAPFAKKLGSAFQKVNFLRDIKSDIEERGRIYLPGVDKEFKMNEESKQSLEKEAENEFRIALVGIMKLPKEVRLGVYLAYIYYQSLFQKIKLSPLKVLRERRVRVSNFKKSWLFIKSFVEIKLLEFEYVYSD